ncbi:MAG: acyltransferase [Prevotella sp.]|nr:acyltransferase [Prevotella sp.]
MNTQLSKFDAIRPFEPEELPEAYDRLLANPQFQTVVKYLYPQVPMEAIAQKMKACKTNLEFQKAFCYGFIKDILAKAAKGCEMDYSAISPTGRYTFLSNHRDIVLDSGILDVLLIDAGFDTTCEIAIGDNLLALPWVKDLVRVNKSFIVQRGLPLREMLIASKLMSEYMHFAIIEKKENIWIAQRSGRAKDSNDRTSEAVLKMMAMAGQGTPAERLKELNIVPLSISYEYDPCDYLKAQELQQKRDDENWKKGPQDDLISMQTGIYGFKGHVHYHCAPCLNDYLSQLPADLPKEEFFAKVAEYIDHDIHRNYQLYPCNYVALDELQGTTEYEAHYTAEDKAFFDKYVEGQLAKVQMPHADMPYLHERILTMYANPAINFLKV